jgi:hypothetical protein
MDLAAWSLVTWKVVEASTPLIGSKVVVAKATI